ncbi:MAG: TlpA disulfide reductase family protein [Cyclobacteriaceae bacterium]
MSRIITAIIFICAFSGGHAQTAKMVKINDLEKMIEVKSDKIQVINFWATWCAPCIKELPFFEQMNASRDDVRVSLVSVDIDLDPDPAKVHRFVARKKLKSDVYILNEENPNSWIDKIDENWSGAIPATLIVNNTTGKRKFVERELKEGDLDRLIESVK